MQPTSPRRPSILVPSLQIFILLLALAGCRVFVPPDAEPPAPVEYPIEHYRVTDKPGDFAAWRSEVRALRTSLREEYPFEEKHPVLEGESRELAFLDKAVDPSTIIWHDPSAFWREPAILSWWELIDETGAIRKVLVVTSNQEREQDARIIAWCLEGKTWTPAIIDGKPSASLRSASINLGESTWHIAYWQKKISEETASVLVVLLIALSVRGLWSLSARRRERRKRDA